MRVVGSVLAVLAVVIAQGEALTCKTTDNYAEETITFTDPVCDPEVKCSRPILNAGGTYEAGETWGCKDACVVENKCVLCDADGCNVEPVYSCKDGADEENAADKKCPDVLNVDKMVVESKCKRPEKLYDTWSAVAFACGGCDGASECKECSGSLCNDPASIVNQNDGLVCSVYTWDTDKWVKSAAAACKGNDADTKICNMPKIGGTLDATSLKNGGCGPCATGKEAVCEQDECETDGEACNDLRVCFSNKENTEDKFCADDDCKRPINAYGVYTAGDWDCGTCAGGTDATCKSCSDADKCNAAPVGINKHECYAYAWKTDKWEKGELAECDSGDDTAIKCNMPTATALTEEDFTSTGCGPCLTADGTKCDVCTTTKCNSAAAKVASLLLFALFYVMM